MPQGKQVKYAWRVADKAHAQGCNRFFKSKDALKVCCPLLVPTATRRLLHLACAGRVCTALVACAPGASHVAASHVHQSAFVKPCAPKRFRQAMYTNALGRPPAFYRACPRPLARGTLAYDIAY